MNEALVVFVRGLIGFISLLIFARLLGKQQVSQLTFFDYVLGITIGSIAGSLTTDLTSRAWPHFIGLVTWTGAVLVIQWGGMKWRYAAKYIDGEPIILILNGKIMEKAMKKIRYRIFDLQQQLREAGAFNIDEVQYAILETNGKLSVLKTPIAQPATPRDLNLAVKGTSIASELIYDGVVIDQNLADRNLSRYWLEQELKKQNISSPSEVFLATVDDFGTLFIDTYRDHLVNPVNISDYPGPY
ncbi:MAG: DUF421 domain-containing protein [Methylocystaceae bacterium]